MKYILIVLLAGTLASCSLNPVRSAMESAERSPAATNDRERLGDQWALLHSENFEYVCNVNVIEERGQTYPAKVWLDENALQRVGLSFPGGQKVNRYIGVELEVGSVARGRCAGAVCFHFDMKDGSKVIFNQAGPTGKITVSSTDKSGKPSFSGDCVANEPH